MNTIRREISKTSPCRTDPTRIQRDTLSFEGESEKFYMIITHTNPFEGVIYTHIALDKEDAKILYKSLSNFLK